MFQMLDGQIEKGVVLEELVVVVHLGGNKIPLPILVDVIRNRIL